MLYASRRAGHRLFRPCCLAWSLQGGVTLSASFGEVHDMQMLCKVSNAYSDVRCPVCEQGFMVYWTRIAAKNRDDQHQGLLDGLRLQHTAHGTVDAHPAVFHLADGPALAPFGEAAGLGMPAMLGVYN